MSFQNLPVLRDFDPSTPDSTFETTGFGLFQDIRDLANAYNAGAQDIRNSALSILSSTPSSQLESLIDAKFISVNTDVNIYCDSSASSGGNGSISTPFNDPISAFESCIDGSTNILRLAAGLDYVVGTGLETDSIIKSFSKDTKIIIVKEGSGTDPKIILNYRTAGATTVSPYIFNSLSYRSSIVEISLYDINLQTTNNSGGNNTSNSGGFLRSGVLASISFSTNSTHLDIATGTALVTPGTSSNNLINISMRGGLMDGDGVIVQEQYYYPKSVRINAVTYQAGSTAKVFSHARIDRAEMITDQPALSWMAKTEV